MCCYRLCKLDVLVHVVKLPVEGVDQLKFLTPKQSFIIKKKKKLVHTIGKTEEPGVLQPMGSQTVGHSLVTKQ